MVYGYTVTTNEHTAKRATTYYFLNLINKSVIIAVCIFTIIPIMWLIWQILLGRQLRDLIVIAEGLALEAFGLVIIIYRTYKRMKDVFGSPGSVTYFELRTKEINLKTNKSEIKASYDLFQDLKVGDEFVKLSNKGSKYSKILLVRPPDQALKFLLSKIH